jgi:hypothetical protein
VRSSDRTTRELWHSAAVTDEDRLRSTTTLCGVGNVQRVIDAFGLSPAETRELFGPSAEELPGPSANTPTAPAADKLATVLTLTELLERKLGPGRLREIARRPAAAYGGETMLGLIAGDRQDELLASVRASFDWSQA